MRLLQQSASTFEAAGEKYAAATARNFLGIAFDYLGKPDQARAAYTEAARVFAELGETPNEAMSIAEHRGTRLSGWVTTWKPSTPTSASSENWIRTGIANPM